MTRAGKDAATTIAPHGTLRRAARWLPLLAPLSLAVVWLAGVNSEPDSTVSSSRKPALIQTASQIASDEASERAGMVHVPAGTLPLGPHFVSTPPGKLSPAVEIASFWLDATEVTNRQFAAFVADSGYTTTAEREGWSNVFNPAERAWTAVRGADWRHPTGPNSSIAGRELYPVVQVSWLDAAAYATWAGKRLPTEYEWEYAARAGRYDADFPWGREERPRGVYLANTWQGWFPDSDRGADGHTDLAPVATYPRSDWGLWDLAGNVWEWCADAYASPLKEDHSGAGASPKRDATGEESVSAPSRRIRRGGSWLCCENYSTGWKLSTRSSASEEARSNHQGFRCASDRPPDELPRGNFLLALMPAPQERTGTNEASASAQPLPEKVTPQLDAASEPARKR